MVRITIQLALGVVLIWAMVWLAQAIDAGAEWGADLNAPIALYGPPEIISCFRDDRIQRSGGFLVPGYTIWSEASTCGRLNLNQHNIGEFTLVGAVPRPQQLFLVRGRVHTAAPFGRAARFSIGERSHRGACVEIDWLLRFSVYWPLTILGSCLLWNMLAFLYRRQSALGVVWAWFLAVASLIVGVFSGAQALLGLLGTSHGGPNLSAGFVYIFYVMPTLLAFSLLHLVFPLVFLLRRGRARTGMRVMAILSLSIIVFLSIMFGSLQGVSGAGKYVSAIALFEAAVLFTFHYVRMTNEPQDQGALTEAADPSGERI